MRELLDPWNHKMILFANDNFLVSLAFARMPRAEARGGMATGDRGVARRVKPGGFGVVPLGFATDAPRGSAGSFTFA